MNVILKLLTGSFILISSAAAQQNVIPDRFSPKEFSIPATPVFDLMGVTPSQVNRTSDIKDFKVDWSFKSWKLNPNLAIQAQPVWEIFYNKKDLSKYQQASTFARRLASLDISIGTVQDETGDRRIGFAAKFNVFKQKDPLLAKEMYTGISEKYSQEKNDLLNQINQLEKKLDTTTNILEKPSLRIQIKSLEEQMLTQNSRRREEINAKAKIFVEENWNASSLDAAFGKVNSYKTDSAGNLFKLRLNRSTGFATWLNGSLGVGKRWLVSGLIRYTWYDEQLDFTVKDINTLEESPQEAIARNKLFAIGLNCRYGNPVYTFFMEFFYEQKSFSTAKQALSKVFTPLPGTEISGGTVKWSVVNPNNITFGGDWRVSRSVILNYGMRCVFDKKWKFTTFTPVATISCMMR